MMRTLSHEMEIYLGILISCVSVPTLLSVFEDRFLSDAKAANVRSIDELERFRPPKDCVKEVEALMNSWYESAQEGWSKFYSPLGTPTGTESFLVQQVSTLVVGHELGHWTEAIYRAEAWKALLALTRQHIQTWEQSEHGVSSVERELSHRLLQDPTVLDNWTREVCADAIGFEHCAKEFGYGFAPSLSMMTNVATGLYFGLLRMLDVFHERVVGVAPDNESHPPANVRRSLFIHRKASEMGLAYDEFMVRQWGAGLAITIMLEKVLDEYLS